MSTLSYLLLYSEQNVRMELNEDISTCIKSTFIFLDISIISFWTVLLNSISLQAIIILYPSMANLSVAALPIPELAPVIITFLFCIKPYLLYVNHANGP